MAEETTEKETIEQQVVAILRTLPPERMQEVLDFVVFIRLRSSASRGIPEPTFAEKIISAYRANKFGSLPLFDFDEDGDAAWDNIFETEGEAVDAWVDNLLAENKPSTPIDASRDVLRRP